MTRNWIWVWDSSLGDLGSMTYTFITIAAKFTLTGSLREKWNLFKKSVLGMTRNWIWVWDSSLGDLGSMTYTFITIAAKFTLTVSLGEEWDLCKKGHPWYDT